jgi:VWFA-related protein
MRKVFAVRRRFDFCAGLVFCLMAAFRALPASAMEVTDDSISRTAEHLKELQEAAPELILAGPLNIKITQIDINQFPYIKTTVSVFDNNGQGIENLTKDNFSLTEQASYEPSPITESIDVEPIAGASQSVNIALVFDRSGSMAGTKIAQSKDACKTFIDNFGNLDKAALVSFSDWNTVRTDLPFTFMDNTGKDTIKTKIDGLVVGNMTALVDGCLQAVNLAAGEIGVKAIVVFTDGLENDSTHTTSELVSAAKAANVPLYTIGLGSDADGTYLTTLAQSTGGSYYYAPNASDLLAIYNTIKAKIQAQYVLSYTTHNPLEDGTIRTVNATVNYSSNTASDSKTYGAQLPPQILLTAETANLSFSTQPNNVALPIKANIMGSHPITSASLWYRQTGGGASYTKVSMALQGAGTLYIAEIPAYAVNAPGVDYYITASDGTLTSSEPPLDPQNNPRQIPVVPNNAPFIIHTPVTLAGWGTDIPITARVYDDSDFVDSVVLYFRKAGQLAYGYAEMARVSGSSKDGLYQGLLPGSVNTQASPPGCDYYIKATDNNGFIGTHGTPDNPHRVNYQPNQLMLAAYWCKNCGTGGTASLSLSAWAYDPNNGTPVTTGKGSYTVYDNAGNVVLRGNLKYDENSKYWTSCSQPFDYTGIFLYEANINGMIGRISFGTGKQTTDISGHIIDNSGLPVPDAYVRLIKQEQTAYGLTDKEIEEVRSNTSGGYAFTSHPAGIYRVEAVGIGGQASTSALYAIGSLTINLELWDVYLPWKQLEEIENSLRCLMEYQACQVADVSTSVDGLVEGTSQLNVIYELSQDIIKWVGYAATFAKLDSAVRLKDHATANLNNFEANRIAGTLPSWLWNMGPEVAGIYNKANSDFYSQCVLIFWKWLLPKVVVLAQEENKLDAELMVKMWGGKTLASALGLYTLPERSYNKVTLDQLMKDIDTPDEYNNADKGVYDLFLKPGTPDKPVTPWQKECHPCWPWCDKGKHEVTPEQITNLRYYVRRAAHLVEMLSAAREELKQRTPEYSQDVDEARLKKLASLVTGQIDAIKNTSGCDYIAPKGEKFAINIRPAVSCYNAAKAKVESGEITKLALLAGACGLGAVISVGTGGVGLVAIVGLASLTGNMGAAIINFSTHEIENDARGNMVTEYLGVINAWKSSTYNMPMVLDRAITLLKGELCAPYYCNKYNQFSVELSNAKVQDKKFYIDYKNTGLEGYCIFISEQLLSPLIGDPYVSDQAIYAQVLLSSQSGTLCWSLRQLNDGWGSLFRSNNIITRAFMGPMEVATVQRPYSWWEPLRPIGERSMNRTSTVEIMPNLVSKGRALSKDDVIKLADSAHVIRDIELSKAYPEHVETYLAQGDCFELRISQVMPLGSDVHLIVQDDTGRKVGFDRDRGVMEYSFPAEHSGRYSNPQIVNIPEANNKIYTIISSLASEESDLKTKGTLIIEESPIRPNSIMVTQGSAINKTAQRDTTISILSCLGEASMQQPLIDVTATISELRTDKGKILTLLSSETPAVHTDPIIPAGQRREYEWRFYVPTDAVGEYKGTITYTSNAGTLTQDVIVMVASKSPSTPTPTPTRMPTQGPESTDTPVPTVTPTPVPTAVIELNGTSFSARQQLTAMFRVNKAIERLFNVYAVLVMPNGKMLNARTLDRPVRPLARKVKSLQAGFTYQLISKTIPAGAPKGEYEIAVVFFDATKPYRIRADAFLDVSAKFIIN